MTGEKNRAQNCLTVSNFKLDSVFRDVFGKSATAITDYLLEHPGEAFDVAPFVHSRCKTPIPQIQEAIDGRFAPEQAEKLKIIRSHMDFLVKLKFEVESEILKIAESYTPQIELLMSVPGIKEMMTAIRIIAEIGVDMSVFETAKHLTSWAGLTPQNNESAGKKKSTRIGKSGAYIKPLLVQISLAASRSDKYPELKGKHQSLKKRRGGKKATIAIARRLMTAIFHMLVKTEAYNPTLYAKSEVIPKNRHISMEQAIALVAKMGFTITDFALNTA